jgi:hypothetical protein
MAISGIENINIGLQNEAAGSDSLYTAFNKSQNNFTTLFSCASPTTNFVAGDGVSVEYSNSNTYLTITNTGVTSLTAGDSSIVLTQSNGNIIITAPGGGGNGVGGVSNINVIGAASGARITSTGGPIISNGIITLDLATSGANAGTYTYPTVTVDQYGRITSIANASSVGTVSSVGVVTTGTGIQISGSPITSAGNISIINTGVTRLNAGTGISLSSSNGNITVSMTTGAAGVTSVGISSNSLDVTNSPITSTGTMSVDLPTNTAIVGNLTVGNNLSITGNLTVSGNVVSNANVIGTLTANNLSVSGASSGNSNVSTVTGNLGLRTLASTYTDNVSAAGTIATAAIHAIGVPTLAASNAVTFTNAASFYIAGGPTAGTNATITTGYSLYVNSGNTYFGGANNVITGNLTVNGNTTYLNVETFVVEDPIISLGGGPNGTALTTNDGKDRGTALQYYTSTPVTAFMGWDNGNGEFTFGSNVTIASDLVTYNTLGNVRGLTWLGNVVGTTANLTTGNMTTGNITTINSGLMQNGTANITIASNGNISIFANANATAALVIANSGINVPGYANVTGLITGGNLTTTGANGTVTANNLTLTGAASGNVNTAAALSNLGFRTVAATYTDTAVAGTQANAAIHVIAQPTIGGGTNAKTYTNMSTFYIANAPAATTNATITNPYSLFVAAGNSYFGGLISASANVTAPIFTSNIAIGTAPFTVTSTTRVTNLNVAYSNVSDYGAIIAQTTGTYYPVVINAGTSGNYALAVGPTGISYNLATNAVTATTFNGNLSATTATVTGNANIGNINSQSTTGASFNISGATQATANTVGGNINITAGFGNGTGNGGGFYAFAGNAGSNSSGGEAQLGAGTSIGTDKAGNITTIFGGRGTGTGAPGNVAIQVSTALVSGTTTQTLSNVVVVSSTGMTLAANSNITMSGASSQISGSNLVSATYLTGTLTTAAQPNITSLGTQTSFTSNGNSVFNVAAANSVSLLASAAKTADMLVLSTNGNPVTAAGVSALQITYVGGAAAVEASAARIDMTPGATTGGIWNGWRFVGTAAATTGVAMNALKVDTIATPGTGTDNVLYVGTGYDNIINYNGTTIIDGTGQIFKLSNGNSNVNIATSAGNVTIAVTGNAVMTVANTGANITGYANAYSIGSTQIGTPATPSGVGSTSGGSLAAATYFFKIVAVDGFGQVTAPSAESTGVTTTGATSSIAVSWTATTAAVSYRIYFATTTNTYTLGYFTSTTNTFTLTTTAGSTAGTIPVNNTTGSVTATGFLLASAGAGLSAAGTVQANATVLTKELNQVTTVAAGTGVVLPQPAAAGMRVFVRNAQAVNALLVYPAANGTINLGAANASFSLALSTGNTFVCVSASPAPGGTWYTSS